MLTGNAPEGWKVELIMRGSIRIGYAKLALNYFDSWLFDDSPEAHGHGKILGGGILGNHASDMIGPG